VLPAATWTATFLTSCYLVIVLLPKEIYNIRNLVHAREMAFPRTLLIFGWEVGNVGRF